MSENIPPLKTQMMIGLYPIYRSKRLAPLGAPVALQSQLSSTIRSVDPIINFDQISI